MCRRSIAATTSSNGGFGDQLEALEATIADGFKRGFPRERRVSPPGLRRDRVRERPAPEWAGAARPGAGQGLSAAALDPLQVFSSYRVRVHCKGHWSDALFWKSETLPLKNMKKSPEPDIDPPAEEPDSEPSPIEEPQHPLDPGPAEDPARQPVRGHEGLWQGPCTSIPHDPQTEIG